MLTVLLFSSLKIMFPTPETLSPPVFASNICWRRFLSYTFGWRPSWRYLRCSSSQGDAMANAEQLRILMKGVEIWNKWRLDNPKIEIDLVGADLSRADLSVADLRTGKDKR